jgi:hypothetical protein
MAKRHFLSQLRPAAGAFCLVLFVFAFLAGCDDLLSNPDTTPDPAVLYPPPNPGPSLTPGESELYVQFTKVEGALSYRIFYSRDSGNPGSSYVTAYQPENQLVDAYITGLTNGVMWYVWAEAWFEDARSGLAGPAEAMPRLRPQTLPTNFQVSANDKSLDLTWGDVTDADSYDVYWSESGGSAPPDGAPSAEFTGGNYAVKGLITGLDNGKTYKVWIRGKNTSGALNNYIYSTGSPQAGGSPGTPAGNIGLASASERLTVRWDAAPQATGYRLFFNTTKVLETAQINDVVPGAGRMNGSIDGLINDTPYYVWVAAVNGTIVGTPIGPGSETPHPKPALNMNNKSQLIGELAARFTNEEAGHGDRLSRKKETAIGDLTADSMYYWAVKHHTGDEGQKYGKIDFAFVNGGVILGGMAKGPITVGYVCSTYYDGDNMSILTMTGAQIKTLFHDYVAKVPHSGGGGKGTGAFGQVSSHVRYTIDYNHDPRGGVISGLTFNGVEFVDTTTYTFVTSTYLLDDNTDGYVPILSQATRYDTGKLIAEAVADWIYDQDGVPIEPKTDGRIVLKNEVW